MSVAPIEKSKASTASLNTSSTSLVISKESGVVLVHPDDKKLPESFEYVQPKKGAGMSRKSKVIGFSILAIVLLAIAGIVPPVLLTGSSEATEAPTEAPTNAPTTMPTTMPPATTNAPTTMPTTDSPTDAPTNAPTNAPTEAPTEAPTNAPTNAPTEAPTEAPTNAPTTMPTTMPPATTNAPTMTTTESPTTMPTTMPSTTMGGTTAVGGGSGTTMAGGSTMTTASPSGGGGGGGSCSGEPSWIGDNFCDDNNNNEGCQWDGGDCCGDNANTQYCQVCGCLDPGATTMVGGSTMSTTAQQQRCCHSLNLTLANEAKAMHGNLEGVFTFSGIFMNGIDAFSDSNGHAIAHVVNMNGIFWYIYQTATNIPVIYASTGDLELYQKCPNNEGYTWKNWVYWNGLGYELAGNDVSLKCVDEGDFCTPNSRCGLDQGDCDVHEDCQSGFRCGSNNCPATLGLGPDVDCCFETTLGHFDYCTAENKCGIDEGDCDMHDECQIGLVCGENTCNSTLGIFDDLSDCCYNPPPGDINFCSSGIPCKAGEGDCDKHDECENDLVCGFKNCNATLGWNWEASCCYNAVLGDPEWCTKENPCAADEGDCDSDDECQTGLFCDTANDCSASLGFASGTNCCGSEQTCASPQWIGDNYCDDPNNNEVCQWDGGDCCGDNVNTAYCSVCACLDPGFSSRSLKRKNNLMTRSSGSETKAKPTHPKPESVKEVKY